MKNIYTRGGTKPKLSTNINPNTNRMSSNWCMTQPSTQKESKTNNSMQLENKQHWKKNQLKKYIY